MWPPAARSALRIGRPLPRFLGVGLCLLGLAGAASATEATGSEPRLDLPGDRIVRAGKWIDLQWGEADAISELEILLSTDGGRHYAVCISPRLDPGLHHFLWRVPTRASGALRMRIRFNRCGREIEGAPTGPLTVVGGRESDPEPLALPPLADGRGAPDSGRREGRAAGSAPSPLRAEDDAPEAEVSFEFAGRMTPSRHSRLDSSTMLASFASHRSFPLRA